LGALIHHILKADPKNYQPMNVNFGLFTALEQRLRPFEKKLELVKRASHDFRKWMFANFE
jgi:methylenetetrahydrofolate--tRNA-(uracil-5-)-methyltransferase